MKMYVVGILTILFVGLSACSDSDKTNVENSGDAATPNKAQPQIATQTPPATPSAPGKPPLTGKVIKAMHAGGYTYMQLENEGKQFWIAATMMNVQRNDHVTWADAAIMKNFTSSTLRRTFDEILFVSAAKVL
ncbi:MAG: NrfJ-related protein [Thiohalomonadales bacterium]